MRLVKLMNLSLICDFDFTSFPCLQVEIDIPEKKQDMR
jgi:hypothetical protein